MQSLALAPIGLSPLPDPIDLGHAWRLGYFAPKRGDHRDAPAEWPDTLRRAYRDGQQAASIES